MAYAIVGALLVRRVAQHVEPERGVPDVGGEVDAHAVVADRREVLGEAGEVPRDAGRERATIAAVVAVVATVVPPSARASTSRKPGPPSDSGSSSTSSWGAPRDQPCAIAVAAWTGPSVEPKESGAMRTCTR